MTSMKDEIAKINRDSEKIRAITKEIKDDSTPDTKQGEGLGEETLKPCPFCGGKPELEIRNLDDGDIEVIVDCPECNCAVVADSKREAKDEWNYRPIEDALTQRVKVLEEAHESPHSRAHREKALELANKERVRYRVALLQIAGMANLMFAECDDAEEIIRIAKEALDLQCGNCGDDGEEPSKNCPTCHGTGFKALAPPVGEKGK